MSNVIAIDPLERAENELRQRAQELSRQIETTYWELGQILYEVYDGVPGGYRSAIKGEGAKEMRKSLFEKWGYSSFEEYCEKEVGIHRRSASNLRYAYYWFEIHLSGLPPEIRSEIRSLGRSKVYVLMGKVTSDNIVPWLEKAKNMTTEELKKAVILAEAARKRTEQSPETGEDTFEHARSASGAGGGSDYKEAPQPEVVHNFQTTMYDGQWDICQQALERAKNISGSDKINHNLDMIFTDYLATNGFTDPKDDLKRSIAKFEKQIGKKIIAIDPQSGRPIYGADLLHMLVETAKQEPTADDDKPALKVVKDDDRPTF